MEQLLFFPFAGQIILSTVYIYFLTRWLSKYNTEELNGILKQIYAILHNYIQPKEAN